jgi:hypothetical protein
MHYYNIGTKFISIQEEKFIGLEIYEGVSYEKIWLWILGTGVLVFVIWLVIKRIKSMRNSNATSVNSPPSHSIERYTMRNENKRESEEHKKDIKR